MNRFVFEKLRENGEDFILKESESGFLIQSSQNNFKLEETNDESLIISYSSLEGYCYTTVSSVMSKIKKMIENYYEGLEVSSFLYDEKIAKIITNIISKNKSNHKNRNNHEGEIQHENKKVYKGKSQYKEKESHK